MLSLKHISIEIEVLFSPVVAHSPSLFKGSNIGRSRSVYHSNHRRRHKQGNDSKGADVPKKQNGRLFYAQKIEN
jgi:hypothetical protein